MKRFEGRNAIITGASRGIGAALSQRLAAEGANLLLVARTLDEPGQLTVEPRAAVMSEGARVKVGDIVREDQIESMEGMVEAIAALCACGPDRTGQIFESLELLEDSGVTVMSLDGSQPHKVS